MSSPSKGGNAFSSPTAAGLMARRTSPKGTGTSSGAYAKSRVSTLSSGASAGLQSVRSAEEQEIIEHIADSTGVVNKKKKSSASSVVSDASTVTQNQVRAALEAANNVLNSNTGGGRSIASGSTSRSIGSSSPATRRLEAAIAEGISKAKPDTLIRPSTPEGKARSRPPTPEGARVVRPDFKDRDSDTRSLVSNSGGSSVVSTASRRQALDLNQNDNGFHVIANLVVSILSPKVRYNPSTNMGELELSKGEIVHLDQVVAPKMKESFVAAVQYRLEHNCPEASEASVHVLTRQCVELGLNRVHGNPLLQQTSTGKRMVYVTDLPPPPSSVPKQTIQSGAGSFAQTSSMTGSHSRTGSGLHQVNSFQVNSDSIADTSVRSSPLVPSASSPTKTPNKPPRPPSPNNSRMARVLLDEHNKRLRAREVELLENASVASVLTNPSGTSEQHLHINHAAASTTESLARKQLMAELREASTLMAESQTPEAAEFWKNHVVSLQSRLRSLHASEGSPSKPHNMHRTDDDTSGNDCGLSLPAPAKRSTAKSPATGGDTKPGDMHYFNSQPNYGDAKYTTEFFSPPLEPNNNNGGPPVQDEPARMMTYAPTPPPLEPLPSANYHGGNTSPPNQQQQYSKPQYSPQQQHHSMTPSQHQQYSNMQQQPSQQQQSPHSNVSGPLTPLSQATNHSNGMVDVVSPADLPGGYHFEAEIDGRRFLATVPLGGVGKGETFLCDMRPLEIQQGGANSRNGKPSVPTGRWRDRLCDWTAHGATHVVNLNALFCPLLALGQVMTRLQLDVFGRPLKIKHDSWRSMWSITAFWITMNVLIHFCFQVKWAHHLSLTIADYVAVTLLNGGLFCYTLYAVSTTRSFLRDKYQIREHRFYDLEDNCCATFCMPCTICQLHRHTAPYEEMEAKCCTKTGLREHANLDFLQQSSPNKK